MRNRALTVRRRFRRSLGWATALLLGLGSVTMLPSPAVAAGVITVDRFDDSTAASSCVEGIAADCSLRGAFAFADANGGAHINVPFGIFDLTAGELQIGTAADQNTEVVGNGVDQTVIRQTTANSRVIDVNPHQLSGVVVSMSGLTVTGGRSFDPLGGGGIVAGGSGNELHLSDCSITDNTNAAGAGAKGGGIEFAAGLLTIDHCTIANNDAGNSTDGFGVGGGVDYQLNNGAGGLSITNTTFSGNRAGAAASSGAGGALHVSAMTPVTPSVLAVSNNTFGGNQANAPSNGLGGAVANFSAWPLTLKFNRIVSNGASGGATGFYNAAGTTDATENWWGCNEGPGFPGCASTGGDLSGVSVAPRLVLVHFAAPNILRVNQASTLTAGFPLDSAGAAVSVANLGQLVGVPIIFGSAVHGSLSGASFIQADGLATATFTANAAGAGSATATVDNADAVAGLTILSADTTTTISGDTPDPSGVGEPVTFTFGVTASNGSSPTAPTGNVTVSDGTQSCTATVTSGQCDITFTSGGTKSVTATYAGDANFNTSSSSAAAHTVNVVDNVPPDVTVNQAAGQADPTSASPIHFTAVFTEPVTGFDGTDVSRGGTGNPTGAVVSEVAPNDGTTYDVAVNGMSAGTVIVGIPAGAAQDGAGNGNTASASTDNTVTYVVTPPDLTIAKTHNGNFTQGQVGATYQLTVSNAGSGASTGAVTAVDLLPAGLTATAISGTGWSCVLPTLTCSRSDPLAPASNYPVILVTVTVDAHAPVNVTNSANVSGGGDTDTSNNHSDDPTTINPVVVDTPPTLLISAGSCQTGLAGRLSLTLGDAQTPAASLSLTGTSSNTGPLPNDRIVFGGSGANRTMTVTPRSASTVRSATITLNLSDGSNTTILRVHLTVGTDRNDLLRGDGSPDIILGSNGNDILLGGDGRDLLCGGDGNDALGGGGDNDSLGGGAGNDALSGGGGADFFSGGTGLDLIADFHPNEGDTKDATIP